MATQSKFLVRQVIICCIFMIYLFLVCQRQSADFSTSFLVVVLSSLDIIVCGVVRTRSRGAVVNV